MICQPGRRSPQEAQVDETTSTSSGKKLLGMAHLGKPIKDLTDEEIDRLSKDLSAKMVAQLPPKE
jgi:hypothetical protein